ncbi:18269_t:CDS:1, partial [Funneliformis geosporum]
MVKNRWIIKLLQLYNIISGLDEIHQKNLIHCDLHYRNILNVRKNILSVSDLGLCKPVEYLQSSKKNDIYGVLPFIAPEILRGQTFTLTSDIYSFSMIMWGLISGVTPFNHKAYDLQLGLNICKGERPEDIKNVPKCYTNLMKKCWDENPLKRPTALEIKKIIEN